MLKHNLITALRAMSKQKMQTLILLGGMAIGLTVSFWMVYWLVQEFTYENVHENADRIYRVEMELNNPGGTQLGSATPTPLAPLLKREYPEIAEVARLHPFAEVTLHYEELSFTEDRIMAVDPAFLSVFTLEPLYGSLDGALDNENSVVLTEAVAEKYFGKDVNPVGERLTIDVDRSVIVTAVIRDLPSNTHLDCELLIPLLLADQMGREIALETWHRFDEIHTYVLLSKNTSWRELEAKIASLQTERVNEGNDRLYLRPLNDIHFATDVLHDFAAHTDKRMLYGLTFIALLVFVMACINFVLLTSAMTLKRRKSLDLRKVYGAGNHHIATQIMTEAFLYSGVAAIAALLCVELTRPLFSSLIAQPVSGAALFSGETLILGIGLTVLMGVAVGIFPAMRFSQLRAATVFRNSSHGHHGRSFHPLMVVHFVLTIALISGAIIVRQQMHYMQETSPGYDRDRLVSIPMTMPLGTGIRSERFGAFSASLMQHPGIRNVTMSFTSPENIATSAGEASWEGQSPDESVMVHWCSIWFDYFETLGIDIVEGRGFSSDFPGDINNDGRTGNYILNETAVKRLGLEDPIGKSFTLYGKTGRIVGVAEDFHYQSFREPIEPVAFSMLPWMNTTLIVRLSPEKVSKSLAAIESVWKKFNPDTPFEYEFTSSAYLQLYESERRIETLVGLFTILAIVLACLGLLGIVGFLTEHRTKEIGVRKVLGASVTGILGMLTTDIVKWILLANLAAWPLAWHIITQWLQNYAYHIDVTIWPFLLAGLATLIIALLTVSWQAVRAATANPVESLRYE